MPFLHVNVHIDGNPKKDEMPKKNYFEYPFNFLDTLFVKVKYPDSSKTALWSVHGPMLQSKELLRILILR